MSKSGTLTYEAADQVVKAGMGISTAIGIGGDPIIGTTTKEAVELLMNDPETDGIIMIGEIGGQLEADAAHWVKANGTKPVVGFIAGQTAPKGRTMGHAGAIVGGEDDTAEAKMRILSECGISVVASPAKIGSKMAELLGVNGIIIIMKVLKRRLWRLFYCNTLYLAFKLLNNEIIRRKNSYNHRSITWNWKRNCNYICTQGANIAFTYLSSEEKAKALEEELSAFGITAKGFKSDASKFEDAQQLADQVMNTFGSMMYW